uniref:Uncharacterized protein n=1 Tax=Takifugu rubripes TaxID=31033 RepID=A0A674N9H3_TAKRU
MRRIQGRTVDKRSYLCRLWTPPSICADAVLFSNFRSPEYIMALTGRNTLLHIPFTSLFLPSPGFCPWRPGSPCRDISLAGCRLRKNIPQELHWWQPAESPSSLNREKRTF